MTRFANQVSVKESGRYVSLDFNDIRFDDTASDPNRVLAQDPVAYIEIPMVTARDLYRQLEDFFSIGVA